MNDSNTILPKGDSDASVDSRLQRSAARTVQITTGARLHFGLLDVVAPFGGCGVMIDHPQTRVEVAPADRFSFVGPESKRARDIASRIAEQHGLQELPRVQVRMVETAPPHSGLGSGTQLSLAITEAILAMLDPCRPDQQLNGSIGGPITSDRQSLICELADRGHRSAVGTHGYFHGGMIAEGIGQDATRSSEAQQSFNPLDERLELPESWRVVIVLPNSSHTVEAVSGEDEKAKFKSLARVSPGQRESLSALLVERLLPAARNGLFSEFAQAVSRYNRASGELFSSIQGGPYNGDRVTRTIERLEELGVAGIGQSSWGPGVFGWFEREEEASQFQKSWSDETSYVLVGKPNRSPRRIIVDGADNAS